MILMINGESFNLPNDYSTCKRFFPFDVKFVNLYKDNNMSLKDTENLSKADTCSCEHTCTGKCIILCSNTCMHVVEIFDAI